MQRPPRALGDILAEENLIGRSRLKQAQRAADRSGAPLVTVLLEQGLIAEDALVRALRNQLDLDVFDPTRTEVDIDAVREIPVDEANRFRLLPLTLEQRGSRRVLRVAMADPLDRHAIEEIEFSTGCIVEPLIGRPSDLSDSIRSHYRSVVTKIIPRGRDAGRGRNGDAIAGDRGAGSGRAPSPSATPGPGSGAGRRPLFGGSLDARQLGTRPVTRVQQRSNPPQRVDALVALLVRKGIITQDEYEEQLSALVDDAED